MFEYELDGEVLQFTQEEVDKRAKEKGLTTEKYLAQHPEVKPVNVEKIQGVAATDAAAAVRAATDAASGDCSARVATAAACCDRSAAASAASAALMIYSVEPPGETRAL